MKRIALVLLFTFVSIFMASCMAPDYSELQRRRELLIYTPLDESVYSPIIKEYEKRNKKKVEVQEKTIEELISLLKEDKGEACDLILGIPERLIEGSLEDFRDIEYLFYYSMVIFYNTEIVPYKEVPVSFDSLLEERWEGKIAFLDPKTNHIYNEVIIFGERMSNKESYRIDLGKNLGNSYLDSMEAIAEEVSSGTYPLGIITQDRANELIKEDKPIAYIASSVNSCRIYDLAAIFKSGDNPQEAREFMRFIRSEEVNSFITDYLEVKPADKSFGEDKNE